ncbi:MAG: helix-turn-helix domain-containing protein [Terriglobia bacterium]
MKRDAEVARRIRALRGEQTQAEFAKQLEVTQPMVSSWEAGRDLPSPEMYLRLINTPGLTRSSDDFRFFFEQAGLTEEAILSAAAKIMGGRTGPAAEGEIIQVPRFRQTEQGRENMERPVPLPAEFIPNPSTAICLSVEKSSPGVASCPSGLIILDASVEGSDWREEFKGHVMLLDYSPKEVGPWSAGLYMGRLLRYDPLVQAPVSAWIGIVLEILTAEATAARGSGLWMPVGNYAEPYAGLGASRDDKEKWEAAIEAFRKRALANLHFYAGVSILGKVLGRLTGHLEESSESANG